MTFTFDLISDLHVETWDNFDWSGQATSPYCVVAGDIARDHSLVVKTLQHLGECYQCVFYIDGNDEHRYQLDNISENYQLLVKSIENIKNVVFLHDHVVIVNGLAILATNGWWSYDLDPGLDLDQCSQWFQTQYRVPSNVVANIAATAYNDAAYLMNSVRTLQTHLDVRAIAIVTHTVPNYELIKHDIQLVDSWRFNTTGNPHMQMALDEDTEKKIKVWCFGHYHQPVDRDLNGIRYVNNCRGRGNTDWCQYAYYPKRITIEY